MAYEAKNSQALGRQLKVQTLSIPFAITGNATPASKAISRDEPALLFLAVEGIDQITAALSSDDTAPTLASASDASGVFSLMVVVGEEVEKVVSAQLVRRNGQEVISCTLPASAPADGIVAGGKRDKIALNADSAVNLSAANYDGCLILQYVAKE
jgi:hypothetical protein